MNYVEFIGIDVSKDTFDVCIHHSNKKEVFGNHSKGFSAFIKWLEKELKTKEMSKTLICFEHTGVYSMNIALFLQKGAIPFVIVPALEIKRSLGVTRGKNDQLDARRIAEYAYLKREQIRPSVLPSTTIRKLQPLLALRDNLVVDRARYIATSGEQKRVFDVKCNQELFDVYTAVIKDLSSRISALELAIQNIINQDQEVKETFELIKGIKGIGPLTAAYLIIYTHNFSRFDNWRKFACYAGIAPFEYQSGTSVKGRTKVSHLANKHIKTLLFLAANNAVKYDNELKMYYQRRLEEGKSKMGTLNIIKNKLIARVFAVAKRKTSFVDIMKYAA